MNFPQNTIHSLAFDMSSRYKYKHKRVHLYKLIIINTGMNKTYYQARFMENSRCQCVVFICENQGENRMK